MKKYIGRQTLEGHVFLGGKLIQNNMYQPTVNQTCTGWHSKTFYYFWSSNLRALNVMSVYADFKLSFLEKKYWQYRRS